MDGFTHTVSSFIAEHRAWAGPIVGLITFGESMVLVGAFLPATVLLVVAGGLVAAGVLDATQVVVFALAGAILGDAASYALGRRLGDRALAHPWLSRHQALLTKTRTATQKYGVATLFVGRFGGPLRAFVPIMAGMMAMPVLRFQIVNALSGVVWVGAFLIPGYLAGRGVAVAANIPWQTLGLGALAALLVLAGGAMILRHLRVETMPRPCAC